MLVIHDEQLAQQLQQIAENENRPIEDVLKTLLAHYPTAAAAKPDKSEAVRRVRQKAYAKARQYWHAAGDTAKAQMTDKELDEQFGVFDEEGIPRLKSEMTTLEPPPGSLAYAAKIAQHNPLHSGNPDLATRADEILNEHFAEDILKHQRGQDATE